MQGAPRRCGRDSMWSAPGASRESGRLPGRWGVRRAPAGPEWVGGGGRRGSLLGKRGTSWRPGGTWRGGRGRGRIRCGGNETDGSGATWGVLPGRRATKTLASSQGARRDPRSPVGDPHGRIVWSHVILFPPVGRWASGACADLGGWCRGQGAGAGPPGPPPATDRPVGASPAGRCAGPLGLRGLLRAPSGRPIRGANREPRVATVRLRAARWPSRRRQGLAVPGSRCPLCITGRMDDGWSAGERQIYICAPDPDTPAHPLPAFLAIYLALYPSPLHGDAGPARPGRGPHIAPSHRARTPPHRRGVPRARSTHPSHTGRHVTRTRISPSPHEGVRPS